MQVSVKREILPLRSYALLTNYCCIKFKEVSFSVKFLEVSFSLFVILGELLFVDTGIVQTI